MKALFFISVLLVFAAGCASLKTLGQEAAAIDRAELQPNQAAVGVLLEDIIPDPYKGPAAFAIGWISCLLRRVYKKRSGSLS